MGLGLLPDALRFREGGQPVTYVELFFDLVFVFAVTQLSGRLIANLSVVGAGEMLFLFMVVWWAWIYTTWMTNWFDPEAIPIRIVLLTGMLASLGMAIAIPDAFEDRALLFAGGYVALSFVRNAVLVLAVDRNEPLHPTFVRILVWHSWVGLIWLAGALVPESDRVEVWLVALACDYAGPLVGFWTPGLGRTTGDQLDIDPEHFSERFHLFVMIVLGESIIQIGAPAAELDLTTARLGALVTAFVLTAFLWWLYFDETAERSRLHLIHHDQEQGRLARDAYTYLHMPIVVGILVAAVGNDLVLENPSAELQGFELWVLAAGPILYLFGHNVFRLRLVGDLWRWRMLAAALIVAVVVLGASLPALGLWAIVVAALFPVVVAETRARIRGAPLVP